MIKGIILAVLFIGTLIYFQLKSKKRTVIEVIDYSPVKSELTKIEYDLLMELNDHRAKLGLNVLMTDELARSLAYEHCKYMITKGKANHDNFPTRSNELTKHGAQNVGETVAYGFSTPKGFLNGYLSSEAHREIIESEKYNYIGVRAIKNSEGRYYNNLILVNFK